MKSSIFFTTILTLLFSFCSQTTKPQQDPEKNQSGIKEKKQYGKPLFNYCPPTIKQGLYGCCTYKTGDCMPIIDTNKCKWYGVKRTIYVYEAATENQTVNAAPKPYSPSNFYNQINTRLIAKTESDNNGCFQIELPVGEYSILIFENDKYYCESWGNNHLLCPVTIGTSKLTKKDLLIRMFIN
jgi:hypothetical protein